MRRVVGVDRWFAGVFIAGVAVRVLAMAGFRPALWFPDSYSYVVTALEPSPDLVRPAGYPMFLRLLEPFHAFAVVTAAQHLLGLATGVLVYVTARRLAAPNWAAVAASAPVLLGAYQVQLEHLLVSDTLFTFLVVAAVVLGLRREIGVGTACAIGVLLAAAALTRTVGLPLVIVVAAWLLIRALGNRGPSAREGPQAAEESRRFAGNAQSSSEAIQHTAEDTGHPTGKTEHSPEETSHPARKTEHSPEETSHPTRKAEHSPEETSHPAGEAGSCPEESRHTAGVTGRRILVASVMLAAAIVPVIGCGVWFHSAHDRIGIVGANGVFLYAKTMTFADCSVMDPPADLAGLCDSRPPSSRPPMQEYVWSADSPLVTRPGITFTEETDALARRFAVLAISSQPLDYVASVAREAARSFEWTRPVYPDRRTYAFYEFPELSPSGPEREPAVAGARFAARYEQGPIDTRVVEPFAHWTRAYQSVVRLPGGVLLLVLLVPPLALLTGRTRLTGWVRLRRTDKTRTVPGRLDRTKIAGSVPSDRVRSLLPWGVAVVLLLAPAAVAQFDYRYVLPAVPLACLAAALSLPRRAASAASLEHPTPGTSRESEEHSRKYRDLGMLGR